MFRRMVLGAQRWQRCEGAGGAQSPYNALKHAEIFMLDEGT